MANEQKDLSFEEALQQLEKIVHQLEEGDVPLEKAIQYYQTGMELSKLCHDKLQKIENQVAKIMNNDQSETPFKFQEEK